MNETIESVLKQQEFWEKLTEEQQKLILKESRVISYETGEIVYSGARECLGGLLVLNGSLRTYLLSDEGKEVTIYRLREGDVCFLAASCILSAITFDVEIEAQGFTQVLLIPARILSTLTKENIYLENFMYKERTTGAHASLSLRRFSDVVEALQQLMFLSLTQRIASFLLDEAAKNKTSSITMTHEEIAKIIGSAREAVSRILKQLAKQGYISLNRGEIKIEKREELYKLL